MKGTCITLFFHQFQKHRSLPLYEWLLEHAKQQGIPGATAMRATAGYGHHMKLREERFFELGSDVPMLFIAVLTKEQVDRFLHTLKEEQLSLFYTLTEATYGTIGTDSK